MVSEEFFTVNNYRIIKQFTYYHYINFLHIHLKLIFKKIAEKQKYKKFQRIRMCRKNLRIKFQIESTKFSEFKLKIKNGLFEFGFNDIFVIFIFILQF